MTIRDTQCSVWCNCQDNHQNLFIIQYCGSWQLSIFWNCKVRYVCTYISNCDSFYGREQRVGGGGADGCHHGLSSNVLCLNVSTYTKFKKQMLINTNLESNLLKSIQSNKCMNGYNISKHLQTYIQNLWADIYTSLQFIILGTER